MPPKKRVSDSAPSPRKRARGTASQPVAIDSQSYQSQPSALSPPPPYTHTFESRLRESQPEDAIVAPAEGSEQATLAPSSEAADDAVDEAFDAHLEDNYDGIDWGRLKLYEAYHDAPTQAELDLSPRLSRRSSQRSNPRILHLPLVFQAQAHGYWYWDIQYKRSSLVSRAPPQRAETWP
ncbi:hypothetical protein A1F94_012798 [Pyrenophora tritici-repentis]|nr:hypothetical protein A1F94_012798 [Pyrenophora tritici-repentis]